MNIKNIFVAALIISITALAFIMRFYKLGQAPKGIYIDEAGQGYSAYSILKTGKDEFGKSYPIVFRSFTDFKTPIYIYTIVPLIPHFDLAPLTVRLPSFIFSIFTMPLIFLLIKKLTPQKIALPLALLTTLLLAISPWHILFGRTNFECNLALFFFLSGVYAFYLSLNKPFLLALSSILFAIALPAYHSQRIVTPAILLLLVLRHRKTIFSKKYVRWTILSVMVGIILSLPTLSVMTTSGFLARAAGLNIFSYLRISAGYLQDYDGIFSSIINSRWFLSTQEFAALYFSYLSPRHMFNLGDYGPRSSFPELSTFYVWQAPFWLYGLYVLLKNRFGEVKFFIISLLLIAPIPAAVTRDPYSTIRALPLVIPQILIISLGIIYSFQKVYHWSAKHNKEKVFLIGSTTASLFVITYSIVKIHSSALLLNEYFRAKEWDWGWEEVVKTLNTLDPSLPMIVDNAREEAHIELAFFLKYDPKQYQKENFEVTNNEYYTNINRNTTIKLGNITTRPINWNKDLKTKQYLVGDELAISHEQIKTHNLTLIREIRYPDKSVAFRVVQVN